MKFRRDATNHFVITELTGHRRHRLFGFDIFVRVERRILKHMQQFTHQVGDTHLYGAAPTRPDGTPGVVTAPVQYSVDNPALVSLTPNTAAANSTQVTITYLAAGTATITVTGINENGQSFSTQFQCIVTPPPPPPNVTNSFVITELS
jgi:hypothetical protein